MHGLAKMQLSTQFLGMYVVTVLGICLGSWMVLNSPLISLVLVAEVRLVRRSLERSGHQACEAAAGDAVAFLRDWLGPRILAGRLTEQQIRLMQSSLRVPPPAPGSLGAAAAGLPVPQGSHTSTTAPTVYIQA